MLGDRIEVLIDIGGGKPPRSEEVVATAAGGKVEGNLHGDGRYEAVELTRSGAVVSKVIVPAGRLVASVHTPRRR